MLVLPAHLNHWETASHSVWLAAARTNQWQIDCSALERFDSSALALLLDLRRSASLEHKTLYINNAPEKLTQLATLYGVTELLSA